jgi:hypothetical protein
MEETDSSKMFIATYQTAQGHNPIHHHHENLKSHIKPTAIIEGLQCSLSIYINLLLFLLLSLGA